MKDIILAWINRPRAPSAMKWDLKAIIIVGSFMALMEVVTAMVWMFIQAIVDPTVDDNVVFQIVGPAFQTIVGGFIGLITGIHIGKEMQDDTTE